jgi:hypothetical protein
MRKRVPVAIVLNKEAPDNCHSYACENDQPSLPGRNVHGGFPLFVRDAEQALLCPNPVGSCFMPESLFRGLRFSARLPD